jgi:hypothetical protein
MFLMRDVAAWRASAPTERARLAGVLVALLAGAAAGGLLLVHARIYAPVVPLAATAAVVAVARAAFHTGERAGAPAHIG